MSAALVLKPGKDKPLKQGHPWIFSGAIARVAGEVHAGDTVDVHSNKGAFLARAYYNPSGSLVARVIGSVPGEQITQAWIQNRIRAALQRRQPLIPNHQTMRRVVASEADFLPGLIVDQYGEAIVFQILTMGMERVREDIIAVLKAVFEPRVLVERSDEAVRQKEGLGQRKEILVGQQAMVQRVTVHESGIAYDIDCWNGHKTGFYLDQAVNRALVQTQSAGRRVLNCCAYTGGFSLAALKGGASHVVSVDESQDALTIAARNCEQNGVAAEAVEFVRADVFKYLRELVAAGQQYELIVLDPPKFVSDKRHLDRACRGYKGLNRLAMQLLPVGGLLVTFSCSGLISRDLFQKVVFGASVDAGGQWVIRNHLSQSPDHPQLLSFPESLYLKGLVCERVS
jgi:23S rRNA (cytosine1962-C5)-methyltransferase